MIVFQFLGCVLLYMAIAIIFLIAVIAPPVICAVLGFHMIGAAGFPAGIIFGIIFEGAVIAAAQEI